MKRTRRRVGRSCLSCRKAKQRCETPSDGAAASTSRANPHSLTCRRCQVLQIECVRTTMPHSAHGISLRRRQQVNSPQSTIESGDLATSLAGHRSSPSRIVIESSSPSSSIWRTGNPSESSPCQPPLSHAMQILDPAPVIGSTGLTSDSQDGANMSERLLPQSGWLERARIACQPIRLLDHLLQSSTRPAESNSMLISGGKEGDTRLATLLESTLSNETVRQRIQNK